MTRRRSVWWPNKPRQLNDLPTPVRRPVALVRLLARVHDLTLPTDLPAPLPIEAEATS